MRIFVKNISESQENYIKGDLASCKTVYAHIRREPIKKTPCLLSTMGIN